MKSYILNEDKSVTTTDNLVEWSLAMQGIDKRRVDLTEFPDTRSLDGGVIVVSTVFLGLDHQFGGGPPLLFETLVQGGSMDGHMARYATWDEAVKGHEDVVTQVKLGMEDLDE